MQRPSAPAANHRPAITEPPIIDEVKQLSWRTGYLVFEGEPLIEVLGLYLSESEGANFWLSVLTDLQHRGVEDILIASVDGLTGFPEAIRTIFPKTEVATPSPSYRPHQPSHGPPCHAEGCSGNTIRYIGWKNQREFMKDLKPVYRAISKQAAKMLWMHWKKNGAASIR